MTGFSSRAATTESFEAPSFPYLRPNLEASQSLESESTIWSQLSLSEEKKNQLDVLLQQLKTERSTYQEQREKAATDREKILLKMQWEARKMEIRDAILDLIPAAQKLQIQKILSKWKGWVVAMSLARINYATLTENQKLQLAEIIRVYKDKLKILFTSERQENTTEEQTKLKQQKDQIIIELFKNLAPFVAPNKQAEFQQFQSQNFLSLLEEEGKKQKKGKKNTLKGEQLGFLWGMLDENSLTDEQKEDIALLQVQKQQKMEQILQRLPRASEKEKTELEEQLKQINSDFLMALKAYIPADKVSEFEAFIEEIPTWNQKAEKKPALLKKETAALAA